MRIVKIDPMEYPLKEGESWWIVHPNTKGVEFKIPNNGITVCTQDFWHFAKNTVYMIVNNDPNNGWITLINSQMLVEMPYYIFARYFDAEAFVRGVADPIELENAKPFDYKPTLSLNKKQLELFED